MGDGVASEYRGLRFRVEAVHDGSTWTGHYCLLGIDARRARQAAEEGRHQWTSMVRGWASRPEAERNACEAAHAAIDALARKGQVTGR